MPGAHTHTHTHTHLCGIIEEHIHIPRAHQAPITRMQHVATLPLAHLPAGGIPDQHDVRHVHVHGWWELRGRGLGHVHGRRKVGGGGGSPASRHGGLLVWILVLPRWLCRVADEAHAEPGVVGADVECFCRVSPAHCCVRTEAAQCRICSGRSRVPKGTPGGEYRRCAVHAPGIAPAGARQRVATAGCTSATEMAKPAWQRVHISLKSDTACAAEGLHLPMEGQSLGSRGCTSAYGGAKLGRQRVCISLWRGQAWAAVGVDQPMEGQSLGGSGCGSAYGGAKPGRQRVYISLWRGKAWAAEGAPQPGSQRTAGAWGKCKGVHTQACMHPQVCYCAWHLTHTWAHVHICP